MEVVPLIWRAKRRDQDREVMGSLPEAPFPPDWPARLAEVLRESRANERLMLAWLDQQGTGEQR